MGTCCHAADKSVQEYFDVFVTVDPREEGSRSNGSKAVVHKQAHRVVRISAMLRITKLTLFTDLAAMRFGRRAFQGT